MPNRDGTGPGSKGSGTGRRQGPCSGVDNKIEENAADTSFMGRGSSGRRRRMRNRSNRGFGNRAGFGANN